jgi:hypothetical protein
MATTCTENVGRKTGWSYNDDGVISFSATRTFIVQSDTQLNGFESVSGLPSPNQSYPGVARARVSSVSATEMEKCVVSGSTVWVWTVEVNYTTQHFKLQQEYNELEDNPLEMPVIYRWSPLLIEVTPHEDLDGKKYKNSAGDLLTNVPTITVKGSSITAVKNFSSFSESYALSLIGKCNATYWLGRPKGTMQIADVSPEFVNNGETSYVQVSITVEYNPLRWDIVKPVDIGPRYKNTDGELVYPEDANGYVSTEPVLLDGDGYKLVTDNPLLPDVDPVFLEFRVADYIDFTTVFGS